MESGPMSVRDPNTVYESDKPVHDWYRFVLSYPPHLIRDYVGRFDLSEGSRVLDPFCGTGTTPVECRKIGVRGLGIEANRIAHFAAATKLNWAVDPAGLSAHAREVAARALDRLAGDGIQDEPLFTPHGTSVESLHSLPADLQELLIKDSISPRPLHKALVLLDCLREADDSRFAAHERLALAKSIVHQSSNLRFGPEVGVGKKKSDAPVVAPWLSGVLTMAGDLHALQSIEAPPAAAVYGDSRDVHNLVEARSVDAVITSPPYPNEKDYTRTTRLESVLLGFVTTQSDLRAMKKELLRSNTRGVYVRDEDDAWVAGNRAIQEVSTRIEQRRIEMGKTSGFEKLYARVTRLYFGGMKRHLAALQPVLRPGARLAYVVGDQASYLRVMIRTGELLADIARSIGYEVEGLDLFRTRFSTATKSDLREEVLLLRWNGYPTGVRSYSIPHRAHAELQD
jgi:hypothetical protein